MNILIAMMIQILVESLPISSSGHLLLAQKMLHNTSECGDASAMQALDFLLHGPALVVMVCYFFTTWWRMVQHRDFHVTQLAHAATYTNMLRPLRFVVLADLVTVVWWCADVAHKPLVQYYFLPIGFFMTAVALLMTKYFSGSKKVAWSTGDAVILGFVQGFALLPGVSRFATTFCAAKIRGYGGRDSFALSFLVQLPLVIAAFCKILWQQPALFAQFFYLLPVCVMVAMTLISYMVMCFVGYLIDHNRLWYFAGYMVLPVILSLYW